MAGCPFLNDYTRRFYFRENLTVLIRASQPRGGCLPISQPGPQNVGVNWQNRIVRSEWASKTNGMIAVSAPTSSLRLSDLPRSANSLMDCSAMLVSTSGAASRFIDPGDRQPFVFGIPDAPLAIGKLHFITRAAIHDLRDARHPACFPPLIEYVISDAQITHHGPSFRRRYWGVERQRLPVLASHLRVAGPEAPEPARLRRSLLLLIVRGETDATIN